MDVNISYQNQSRTTLNIELPRSKSISNRLLIIDALSRFESELIHLSAARDTRLMQELLLSTDHNKNAKDAGTTYRFLTSFLSLKSGEAFVLDGEERMYQRPIGILVDTLRKLGADIEYLDKEGYPPLKIMGRELKSTGSISISGSISSQFISSLLLIGPYIMNGLTLKLIPPIASRPYISMTIKIMRDFGAEVSFENNTIIVNEKKYTPRSYRVEADWSAACFFYTLSAATKQSFKISGLKNNSLQSDHAIANIMQSLGTYTHFNADGLVISSEDVQDVDGLYVDCQPFPDLVPALVIALAIKGKSATLSGVGHLRYKESDRILALQTELKKVGVHIKIDKDILHISGKAEVKPNTIFDSYRDHRMAMSLALLATQAPIKLRDAEVVDKSFPRYWETLGQLGFDITEY